MVIEAPGWLGTSLVGCGLRRLFHPLPESFEGKFHRTLHQPVGLDWFGSLVYSIHLFETKPGYNVWMNVGSQDNFSVLMWGMRNWSYHPSWALLHSALTRIAPFQSCPIWRFPKSWGYPQLSSFVVGIFQYTPLLNIQKAIEHVPFIVELPIKHCDFPSFCVCLPEGKPSSDKGLLDFRKPGWPHNPTRREWAEQRPEKKMEHVKIPRETI